MSNAATPAATPESLNANHNGHAPQGKGHAPERSAASAKRVRETPPRQEKPFPDFPLFWHTRGYWACKRNGRQIAYCADWKEAYKRHLQDEDLRTRGEEPAARDRSAYTVRDAINVFLTRQAERMEAGEIQDVQLAKYRRRCEQFGEDVGLTTRLRRLAGDDGPELFSRAHKAAMARGLVAADQYVFYIRAMCTLAEKRGLMPPPFYGESFEPPTAAQTARAKIAEEQEHGERAWGVEELRTIVSAAAEFSPHLYAQVLLGLNCAFGADDCAIMRETWIDRKRNLIRGYRGKNTRKRICPIWPVTLAAIDASRQARADAEIKPAREEWANRVFLTENGFPVARKVTKLDDNGLVKSTSRVDSIQQNFVRMLERAEFKGAIEQAWDCLTRTPRATKGRGRRAAAFDLAAITSIEQVRALLGRFGLPGPKTADRKQLAKAGIADERTFDAAKAALEARVLDAGLDERPLKLIKRKCGFYTLRAMFRSLAVGCGVDRDLISVIKGQKFALAVDEYYLRGDLRGKLCLVSEHVFAELFGGWSSPIRPAPPSPAPAPPE